MTKHEHGDSESDLPADLSKPAQRALAGAGYTRLEQLANASAAEIMRLHGMGPKAFEMLRSALAAKGLAFAEKPAQKGSAK
jgi:hypothetical protein